MISPLKEHLESNQRFVVCDIENQENGEVLSIDTAWKNDDQTITHILHTTWNDFVDWIFAKARDNDRFRCVYAHNGGGWDWLSLSDYLLKKGRRKRQTITAACAASKMITMTVKIEAQFTITFCDSLQLLRSSLDKLAKKFLNRGKIDTGGLMPWDMPWDDMISYQKMDTELLLLVLEKTLDLIRERVAKIDALGFTVGSTALKIFKTMGNFNPIKIPENPDQKSFYRRGYAGGRVEVFRYGHFQDVKVYDVNSLYPYAMMQADVPLSDRVEETMTISPHSVGVFDVEFEQQNHDIPPVLTYGGKGIYAGSGVWYTPELHLLLSVDPSAKIKVKSGYNFIDTGKVFKKYVESLYSLRLEDPDGPLSLLCKFLLNSLYGKFGQKSERESIVVFDDFIHLDIPQFGESKFSPICEETGVHKMTLDSECKFEHIPIASIITSFARATLYRGIMATGTSNILYCDTDSVHTLGDLPASMVGREIGQFKLEFSGEACYAGKKLYGLRDNKGDGNVCQWPPKIRAKGVSIGGRNGCRFDFDALLRVANGGKFVAEFTQPTTALQTFKGCTPCRFGKRKRTLRKV